MKSISLLLVPPPSTVRGGRIDATARRATTSSADVPVRLGCRARNLRAVFTRHSRSRISNIITGLTNTVGGHVEIQPAGRRRANSIQARADSMLSDVVTERALSRIKRRVFNESPSAAAACRAVCDAASVPITRAVSESAPATAIHEPDSAKCVIHRTMESRFVPTAHARAIRRPGSSSPSEARTDAHIARFVSRHFALTSGSASTNAQAAGASCARRRVSHPATSSIGTLAPTTVITPPRSPPSSPHADIGSSSAILTYASIARCSVCADAPPRSA